MAKIVRGEDGTLRVEVIDKRTNKPYDFTGFESATGQFPSATDGTPINVSGTNLANNILQFPFTKAQSATFGTGDSLDFWYKWHQSGQLYIESIEGQLNIVDSPYES